MKNIYLPIIILLINILLSGCYKHDEINSLSEEKIVVIPEDSKDPLDHFIYEFYKKYNTVIYYKYNSEDYQWNMAKRSESVYTQQTDKYVLDKGIEYLKRVFLDSYDDEFKKNHFPPAIYLAEDIYREAGFKQIYDDVSYYGISHVAVGRINDNVNTLSLDSLKTIKGVINGDFWGGYLFASGKMDIPVIFYELSKQFYEYNLFRLPENKDENGNNKPRSEIDLRRYGFFEEDPSRLGSPYYMMGPTKAGDLTAFIKVITTHTTEEMDALMDGASKVRDKYTILINYIKQEFGIDLQEIGNQQIK